MCLLNTYLFYFAAVRLGHMQLIIINETWVDSWRYRHYHHKLYPKTVAQFVVSMFHGYHFKVSAIIT